MATDRPTSHMANARAAEPAWPWPWEESFEARYALKVPAKYTEFERTYPPDRSGEEAADNARVWKIYRDRMKERDQAMVDGWNKSLDILLIFAGLFSAVSTAFIIESYKSLRPDYTEYVARAYLANIAPWNESSKYNPAKLKHPDDFAAPSDARWTNGLWFVSLASSLLVALLDILAKQWLEEYSSRLRAHSASPRRWAWRHLVYRRGLRRYHLEAFLSALPLMLHGSLFLFLFGLVLFMWNLDRVVAGIILSITGSGLLLYVCTTFAPIWISTFPTATPLLRQCYRMFSSTVGFFARAGHANASTGTDADADADAVYSARTAPFERADMGLDAARMDAEVIFTMVSKLPAEEDVCVALQAIGSLDPRSHPVPSTSTRERASGTDDELEHLQAPLYTSLIERATTYHFGRCVDAELEPADVARWLRTVLFLEVRFEALIWRTDQWLECRTHDVALLAEISFNPQLMTINVGDLPVLNRHFTAELVPPPFLACNLLLLVGRGDTSLLSLEFCTAMFSMVAPYTTAVPTDQWECYMFSIAHLLWRVEAIVQSDLAMKVPIPPLSESRAWNAAGLIIFRALNIFGLLFSLAADSTQRFEPALCAALTMTIRENYGMPSSGVFGALAFVTTPAFAAYTWPDICLAYLLRFVFKAFFASSEVHTVNLPSRVLYATLAQCARRYPLFDINARTHMRSSFESLILHLGSFQSYSCLDHASTLARAPSGEAATQGGLLGLLHPQRVESGINNAQSRSSWGLILDVAVTESSVKEVTYLTRSFVTQLCILRRSDIPVRELFMELIRGETEAHSCLPLVAQLVFGSNGELERFAVDVRTAQHAREISSEWWAVAAKEMREMPAPTMQSRNARFSTLSLFADYVEALGECPDCPPRVSFAGPIVHNPPGPDGRPTAVAAEADEVTDGFDRDRWTRRRPLASRSPDENV